MKKILCMSMSMIVIALFFVGCEPQQTSETVSRNEVNTEYVLPFCEPGTVEFTYAGVDNWYPPASYTQSLPVWEEIEKRTGIKINFNVSPANQYDTAMLTKLAAGTELPDIIQIPPWSNGDVIRYVDEDIIVPLDGYIEKYAPNIKALFERYPHIKKGLTAPDGHIYHLTNINTDLEKPTTFIIRQDWLDKLGMAVPETIDDWYNVLTAFRDTDLNENGLKDEIPLTCSYSSGYMLFGGAFGLQSPVVPFWAEDGVVSYQYARPEFKELLAFLNKLYKEKLIDPQFTTGTEANLLAIISKNVVGLTSHSAVFEERCDKTVASAGAYANHQLILPPRDKDGNSKLLRTTGMENTKFALTKNCKTPELAVKWMDFIWANPEGLLLTNFGILGETYVMENDKPKFTDKVMGNESLDAASVLRSYGAFQAFLMNTAEGFNSGRMSEKTINAIERIMPNTIQRFPDVLPTKDEQVRWTSISADVNTYVDEKIIKFIMGQEPLENFDKFTAQIKEMGIDELVKIRQTQYDRHMKN